MRSGFLVVTLVALGSTASAACGGSSSETPFPIEPNQAELRSGMLTRAQYVPVSRRTDGGRQSAEEQGAEPGTDPSEATEGARGADDETNEKTPVTGSPASEPPPSDTSEADAGAPAQGGKAAPTWGEPRAPKR